MGLKEDVFAAIKEIESNKAFPETARKLVPIMLLLIKTNISLKEMKDTIEELIKEKKILFFSNESITRIAKFINQNSPTQKVFLDQPTDDELFVYGHVFNREQFDG